MSYERDLIWVKEKRLHNLRISIDGVKYGLCASNWILSTQLWQSYNLKAEFTPSLNVNPDYVEPIKVGDTVRITSTFDEYEVVALSGAQAWVHSAVSGTDKVFFVSNLRKVNPPEDNSCTSG